MRNLIRIALEGAFTNFKRIFFAADRVTDMALRNQISTLNVKVDDRIDEVACIGCSGCSNVCPTGAIDMKTLASPVKLTEDWTISEVPEINLEKCGINGTIRREMGSDIDGACGQLRKRYMEKTESEK